MTTLRVHSAPDSRFVLLHHVLSDDSHWDLMLEAGPALATWRLAADPTASGEIPGTGGVPARRIADHRPAYLDYEGPVSGNRGHVRQVDAGTYSLLEQSADCWVVRLSGSRLRGVYHLPAGQAAGTLRRRQSLSSETDRANG